MIYYLILFLCFSIEAATKRWIPYIPATGPSLQTPSVIHYVDTPASAQDAYWTNNNGVARLALPETNIAGQTIMLGVIFQGTASSAVTVGDDKTNTWTQATYAADATDGYYGYIFYASNILASTRVIQLTNSGSTRITNVTFAAMVVNNIQASLALDGTNTFRNSSSTTVSSGSITPSQSGDFIFQYSRQVSGTLNTAIATASAQANTSFKLYTANKVDAHWMQGGVYSSSSALNSQITLDTAEVTLSLAAAFKASATTTGGTPAGMYIAGIPHVAVLLNVATTEVYQTPTLGNLLVESFSSGGSNYIVTNITGSAGSAWTQASGSPVLMPTGAGAGQFWYQTNGTPNATLRTTNIYSSTTPGHGTIFFYDIVGAASSSPEDFLTSANPLTQAGSSPGQVSATNIYAPNPIIPSVSGGVILAQISQDLNTVHDITSGYQDMTVWDGNNVSGPSQLDQNNGWAHFRPSDSTTAISFTWNYVWTTGPGNYVAVALGLLPSGQTHTAAKFSHIQSAQAINTSATTLNCAYAANNTAGSLLWAGVRIGANGRTITVTDSKGNTWRVAAAATSDAQGNDAAIYYATNAISGANTVTVAISGAAASIRYAIHEVTASTTTTLDTAAGSNFSASTTPGSGNITTAVADEFLVGLLDDGTSGSDHYTPNSPWAQREVISGRLVTQDRVVKATGTYASGFTVKGSTSGRMVIAAFK